MTRWGLIVDEIVKRLAVIEKDNGYRTDMGKEIEVIGIEMDPDEPDEETSPKTEGMTVNLLPGEPGENQVGRVEVGARRVVFDQEISIFGFLSIARRDQWFDASQMILADIKQAIFGQPFPAREFGIKSISIGTGEVMMPGKQDRFAVGNVPIIIRYVENLSRPWTDQA